MDFRVNSGTGWTGPIKQMAIKIGSSFTSATSAYIKVGSTWKQFYNTSFSYSLQDITPALTTPSVTVTDNGNNTFSARYSYDANTTTVDSSYSGVVSGNQTGLVMNSTGGNFSPVAFTASGGETVAVTYYNNNLMYQVNWNAPTTGLTYYYSYTITRGVSSTTYTGNTLNTFFITNTFLFGSTITINYIYYSYSSFTIYALGPTGNATYAYTPPVVSTTGFGVGTLSYLAPGLVPSLSAPTSGTNSFTFSLTNYNSSYTWTANTTAGTISPSSGASSGQIYTVSGLSLGQSATATVFTSRAGYTTQSASVTGSALATQLTVSGSTGTAPGSFTVQWSGAPTGTALYDVVISGPGTSSLSPSYSQTGLSASSFPGGSGSIYYTGGTSGGSYTAYVTAKTSGGATLASASYSPIIASTNVIPSTPVVSALNNLFPHGGTFYWNSATGTTPIGYIFTIYSPPDAYGVQTIIYSTYSTPQYFSGSPYFQVGTGYFTIAGTYTIYVYGVNVAGSSGTAVLGYTFT